MEGNQQHLTRTLIIVIVWLLALCSLSNVQAQEKSGKIVKESITSSKKKRTYSLYVPASAKGPTPLIVLLHGSGRDGLSLVEKWKDLADKEGFIIVGPDAESGGGWLAPRDGPEFLRDLVESLKSRYSINPRRVYLFGHSAGAVFALMMATVESEYFAAMAIHAGAFRSREEFGTIDNARRKIPLAIWVGTKDQYFPLSDVHATRDAFQAKGFPIEVAEIPDHDHWYYDLAPTINHAAWDFLKKYELNSEPRYTDFAEPGNSGDANKLLADNNRLSNQAQDVVEQTNDKDRELSAKDFNSDRPHVQKIAQDEAALLKTGAELYRQAADKARLARQLKIGEKNRKYFAAIEQYDLKWAEVLDAMREKVEALLGNESFEVIEAKRNDAQKRADKLRAEVDELEKAVLKLMP
jgi:predicted esterase